MDCLHESSRHNACKHIHMVYNLHIKCMQRFAQHASCDEEECNAVLLQLNNTEDY